jgi:hypothetical protein
MCSSFTAYWLNGFALQRDVLSSTFWRFPKKEWCTLSTHYWLLSDSQKSCASLLLSSLWDDHFLDCVLAPLHQALHHCLCQNKELQLVNHLSCVSLLVNPNHS